MNEQRRYRTGTKPYRGFPHHCTLYRQESDQPSPAHELVGFAVGDPPLARVIVDALNGCPPPPELRGGWCADGALINRGSPPNPFRFSVVVTNPDLALQVVLAMNGDKR